MLKKYLFEQYMKIFMGAKNLRAQTARLPNGEQVSYFVYRADDAAKKGGQFLPVLEEIIVEEDIVRLYSNDVKNYVLAHEAGHKKTNRIIFYPVVLALLFTLFVSALAALEIGLLLIMALIAQITYFPLFAEFIPSLPFLSFGLLIYLILSMILSWPLEFYADYRAIKIIGLDKYKLCIAEMEKKRSVGRGIEWILMIVINRLTHPYPKIVIFVYEKLNPRKTSSP